MDLNTHLFLVCSISILYVVSMYLSVLELYAVCYLLQVMGCAVLVEIDMIYLLLQELRMCELRCITSLVMVSW